MPPTLFVGLLDLLDLSVATATEDLNETLLVSSSTLDRPEGGEGRGRGGEGRGGEGRGGEGRGGEGRGGEGRGGEERRKGGREVLG